ncbi:PREDICTED: uncharacterized protein LOC109147748 [Ipomoea nil]|uniref:uncharacterized protein LOC109147748 n=1 Tax=Ipomoea nil TaxID=35883 RepID=UPI00090118E7|nr:PREDICTED: uncharacterized protein LOC109147748 [Ipomoea nil]
MVSELRHSYAAVVTMNNGTGEGSASGQTSSPPANQVPIGNNPIQRSDEFDDPFYLHITDNPNLVLVFPPLSEHNYASWSRSMKITLEVKNKFGFANGSIPNPGEADPRFSVWKRCNTIVCSWILKSLNSSIAETVLYYEIAADIWKALKKRYSQADPHRIAELQNQIYRNLQGNLTVNEYFTKCSALWEKMNAMRPLLVCECAPRCTCNLLSKMQKERADDQVIRFLDGLNDEFESIKSGVLVMDPIPDMEKNGQNQVSEEESLVAVSASNFKKKFNNSGGKNVPKCTYCNMTGHTVEKCYKKHGYPPGWIPGYKAKSRQNQDAYQSSNSAVNQVGDIGISSDQFQRLMNLIQNQGQGSQSSTNAVVTVNTSGMKAAFKNTSESPNEGSFVSNLLINAAMFSTIWILDSGATDHITCSPEYFESCRMVVKLPNGEAVSVSHIGEIRLDHNILLRNDFHGTTLGFAKEKNGLYLISKPPVRRQIRVLPYK